MKTLTQNSVRQTIQNNPNLTNKELSQMLGCTTQKVSANKIALNKQVNKQATSFDILKKIEADISKVKKEVKKNKKSITKLTNTYVNSGGVNKEIARNKMVDYVLNSKLSGKILSLPFSTWTIEKKILNKSNSYNFLGVERDKNTFKDMRKAIRGTQLPFEVFNGDVNQKIYGTKRESYSHMILDYCGTLNTIVHELEYAIERELLQVGGMMFITMTRTLRKIAHNERLNDFASLVDNSDRNVMSDMVIKGFFFNAIGKNHRIKEVFHYSDVKPNGNEGAKMVMYVIERIK